MRRLIALLAGGLGLRAILRRRARAARSGSPADDLRSKIAQARTTVEADQQEASAPAEVAVDQVPAPPSDARSDPPSDPPPTDPPPEEHGLDERRADVHARARQAIDDLGSESEGRER